jgi:hypothetical protein
MTEQQDTLEGLWKDHDASTPDPAWVARTHRRRRRAQALGVFGEAAGGASAVAVAVWFVARAPTPQTIALLAIVALVVAASWASTWRAVRALRRGREVTTGDHLAGLLSDARVTLAERRRYGKLVLLSAALIAPWALFVLATRFDLYAAEPWRALVGFGGIAVILFALRWTIRAKIEELEDEIARLEAWLSAFSAAAP